MRPSSIVRRPASVVRRLSFLVLLQFSLVLLLGSCASQPSAETTATIGTFNIEWLGDGINDRVTRSDADHLRIADIIIKSGADVLGVQEIENERALKLILRYLDGYDGFVTEAGSQQRVGVIYRKGIKVEKVTEYRPLQLDMGDRLRPGLVVSCRKGSFDWIQMVVHLKSTSRFDSTQQMREESRLIRSRQAAVIQSWADSVLSIGGEQDVIVTGDWNDFPLRQRESTLDAVTTKSTLTFLTKELKSCSNPKWYVIDHVVTSTSATKRFVAGTERTENVRAYLDKDEVEKVSDHCPIVAQFDIIAPDND